MKKSNSSKEYFDKICKKIASDQNIKFIESTFIKEPRGKVVTAYIDKDTGITLDDCEKFHRELIKFCDNLEHDVLEVSSLGADKPITSYDDFERNSGQVIEIKLFKKIDGLKLYKGIFTDYTDEYIEISINNNALRFNHKDVAVARPFIDVDEEIKEYDINENKQESIL